MIHFWKPQNQCMDIYCIYMSGWFCGKCRNMYNDSMAMENKIWIFLGASTSERNHEFIAPSDPRKYRPSWLHSPKSLWLLCNLFSHAPHIISNPIYEKCAKEKTQKKILPTFQFLFYMFCLVISCRSSHVLYPKNPPVFPIGPAAPRPIQLLGGFTSRFQRRGDDGYQKGGGLTT